MTKFINRKETRIQIILQIEKKPQTLLIGPADDPRNTILYTYSHWCLKVPWEKIEQWILHNLLGLNQKNFIHTYMQVQATHSMY